MNRTNVNQRGLDLNVNKALSFFTKFLNIIMLQKLFGGLIFLVLVTELKLQVQNNFTGEVVEQNFKSLTK